MKTTLRATVLAASMLAPPAVIEAAERTVYVTVVDGNGAAVTDLTAADLVVKEGGKEREIVKAGPASAKLRLTIAVEERLMADAAVRQAMFAFMKRVIDRAEIRLVTIGLRNNTAADYTSALDVLVAGINKLTLNPRPESQVAEGVNEVASELIAAKPERSALVVLAFSGGQAGVDPRSVLEKVRQSGVTMSAVTLAGGTTDSSSAASLAEHSGREQVLGDGPKQSGGRRLEVPSTGAFPQALQQIANDLLAQYAITYTLPEGIKPDKRFSISSKRRGVTLRAPSMIPDR
ncbi:MAG TPA: hypothetical protein VFT24_11310 [Vicinamibacterales bacterium]|nr:hypothetical protein [Vicinamibacterales bacterium]